MAGKKGMKHYPIVIKAQAVRMHLEDGVTNREINEHFGIVDEQRIRKWCAIYRKKGLSGLQYQHKGRARKSTQTEHKQIEYEVKQLRMENELLLNFLYEVGRS